MGFSTLSHGRYTLCEASSNRQTLLWLLFIKSTNPINMNPQRNCKETLFGATKFQKINELHLLQSLLNGQRKINNIPN